MTDYWATLAAAPPSVAGTDLHLELTRTRAARRAHGCPARGRAHGAPGARHPAAVDPFARRRPRRRPEHRGRRLRRTDRRGLADRPAGLRDPGGQAGRAAPGRARRCPNAADPASSHVRTVAGLAEPGGVSPDAMAHRGPTRSDRGAARRLRLRRRPRPARAAHRPRGLSGAGPRRVRRAGADHHLLRFPPRSDADGAGTAGTAGTGSSCRVVRFRRLSRPADQRRPAHPTHLRRRKWRAHRAIWRN